MSEGRGMNSVSLCSCEEYEGNKPSICSELFSRICATNRTAKLNKQPVFLAGCEFSPDLKGEDWSSWFLPSLARFPCQVI